ncbi:MAG: hypothetical protein J3R72DRAFT_179629 [Linnemannia gamsii]|nr:MAG: hypothetical protein J3R72DRAFT_179629 [Linnemannia gamsii]
MLASRILVIDVLGTRHDIWFLLLLFLLLAFILFFRIFTTATAVAAVIMLEVGCWNCRQVDFIGFLTTTLFARVFSSTTALGGTTLIFRSLLAGWVLRSTTLVFWILVRSLLAGWVLRSATLVFRILIGSALTWWVLRSTALVVRFRVLMRIFFAGWVLGCSTLVARILLGWSAWRGATNTSGARPRTASTSRTLIWSPYAWWVLRSTALVVRFRVLMRIFIAGWVLGCSALVVRFRVLMRIFFAGWVLGCTALVAWILLGWSTWRGATNSSSTSNGSAARPCTTSTSRTFSWSLFAWWVLRSTALVVRFRVLMRIFFAGRVLGCTALVAWILLGWSTWRGATNSSSTSNGSAARPCTTSTSRTFSWSLFAWWVLRSTALVVRFRVLMRIFFAGWVLGCSTLVAWILLGWSAWRGATNTSGARPRTASTSWTLIWSPYAWWVLSCSTLVARILLGWIAWRGATNSSSTSNGSAARPCTTSTSRTFSWSLFAWWVLSCTALVARILLGWSAWRGATNSSSTSNGSTARPCTTSTSRTLIWSSLAWWVLSCSTLVARILLGWSAWRCSTSTARIAWIGTAARSARTRRSGLSTATNSTTTRLQSTIARDLGRVCGTTAAAWVAWVGATLVAWTGSRWNGRAITSSSTSSTSGAWSIWCFAAWSSWTARASRRIGYTIATTTSSFTRIYRIDCGIASTTSFTRICRRIGRAITSSSSTSGAWSIRCFATWSSWTTRASRRIGYTIATTTTSFTRIYRIDCGIASTSTSTGSISSTWGIWFFAAWSSWSCSATLVASAWRNWRSTLISRSSTTLVASAWRNWRSTLIARSSATLVASAWSNWRSTLIASTTLRRRASWRVDWNQGRVSLLRIDGVHWWFGGCCWRTWGVGKFVGYTGGSATAAGWSGWRANDGRFAGCYWRASLARGRSWGFARLGCNASWGSWGSRL